MNNEMLKCAMEASEDINASIEIAKRELARELPKDKENPFTGMNAVGQLILDAGWNNEYAKAVVELAIIQFGKEYDLPLPDSLNEEESMKKAINGYMVSVANGR